MKVSAFWLPEVPRRLREMPPAEMTAPWTVRLFSKLLGSVVVQSPPLQPV